jgi:serine/threonine protein kinase
MMEYNPCGVTLSEHLLKNRESLSLDSKMQLLIHISNSLRFLQSSNIVHMDLNLNNILIYDGYLPKLIDFG